MGLCRLWWDYLGSGELSWVFALVGLSRPRWGYPRSCRVILGLEGLSGLLWGYLGSAGVVWGLVAVILRLVGLSDLWWAYLGSGWVMWSEPVLKR